MLSTTQFSQSLIVVLCTGEGASAEVKCVYELLKKRYLRIGWQFSGSSTDVEEDAERAQMREQAGVLATKLGLSTGALLSALLMGTGRGLEALEESVLEWCRMFVENKNVGDEVGTWSPLAERLEKRLESVYRLRLLRASQSSLIALNNIMSSSL